MKTDPVCISVDFAAREVCLTWPPRVTVRWRIALGRFAVSGDDNMALTLTADQQADLSVTFTDDHGNPAAVDGLPTWAVSDPAILTFTVNGDGLGGTLAAVGTAGTGQVTVNADADLGAGIVNITGILDVEVVAGMASAVQITAGTPTPKP